MGNIAYAFLGPFPKGNVSTIRILSYTKEIVVAGGEVTVYILAPTNDAKINKDKVGVFNGVKFEYLSKITWGSENVFFLIKYLYYFFGICKFVNILLFKKHNCVLSYHNELIFNTIVSAVCKFKKIQFNLDITEYPKGYNNFSKVRKGLEKMSLRMYNGIITVSDELEGFYYSIMKKKVFKLPITIDSDRYKSTYISIEEREEVITSVFGTHNRDGLINTFEVYRKYYTDCKKINIIPWKLQIIGNFESIQNLHKQVFDYVKTVKNEEFFNSIVVRGQIDNTVFPYIISNSKVLINTPITFVSGGFPTKLGEYLLSGIPVIYTRAGEVSRVLTDKENAFLFESNEIDVMASCLLSIHCNYSEANEIGLKGRKLALEVFNAKTYINKLLNYCYNENQK